MRHWRRFLHKLQNVLRPGLAERNLSREIESHLQLLQDEFQRRGMNVEEARLAAKRAYGGVEQAKELQRDARSWLWLEQVCQDVRISMRMLLKSPGFSLAVVLTLGLGIGANTTIFSLIDAVLLKTLPVSHPEQLLQISMGKQGLWGIASPYLSNPVWEQLRDRQDIFSGIFAYSTARFNLAARGEARYVQGNYASGDFFHTLGLTPIIGRVFTTSDDRRGCRGTAVLGYGFWQREFGGNTNVVGKPITLDKHPFEILGIIGRGFTGADVGRESEIYVPLCAEKIIRGENSSLDLRAGAWLSVLGRPKPRIAATQAEARLKTLAGPIFDATMPPNLRTDQQEIYRHRTVETKMAAHGLSTIRGNYGQALMVLMVIVGVILLIACANVANLFLARSAARQREMGIRVALGSGRGRLLCQLLTESFLLSFGGAALGVVFARWGARMLVDLLASNVYEEKKVFLDLGIDWRFLAFAAAATILTSLLFGLTPAWGATQIEPQSAMKARALAVMRGRKLGSSQALVVIQVALSLVLVSGAAFLVSTLLRLERLNPGFDREHVLLVQVNSMARRNALFDGMLAQLRALPGVRSASYSDVTPIEGSVGVDYAKGEGRSKDATLIYVNRVSDGFFKTLGMRLLAGRDFNAHDTVTSRRVAIVNQTMAAKLFAGQNPIGRRYRPAGANKLGDPVEVIGIVQDAKYFNLREEIRPTSFVAASQDAKPHESFTFSIRAAGSPTTLISVANSALTKVDRDASLRFGTLAGQVSESLARERMLATLSGFFGALALVLATIGLCGVTSYQMARRRSEIGIRMALGAQRSTVLRGVLGEVMMLIVAGLAIGLCATVATTRFLTSFLYGVKANDPRTLLMAAGVLAVVTATAGLLPALRAARMDPMTTLREE